jgi:hypothetical protein
MTSSRALRWFPLACLLPWTGAWADETVSVCFNYSCVAEKPVDFSEERLLPLRDALAAAHSSTQEREILAVVVGRLYAVAAEQTPIGADRAGNRADEGMPGRMDCIDHSTTTTRLLRMLEKRRWLRFHRVLDPVRRGGVIFQHFSAAIEDLGDGIEALGSDAAARTWVVDSWYADNGKPAWVAPLAEWKSHREIDL